MQVEARFSNEPRLKIDMTLRIDKALRKWVLIGDPSAILGTRVKTIMRVVSKKQTSNSVVLLLFNTSLPANKVINTFCIKNAITSKGQC